MLIALETVITVISCLEPRQFVSALFSWQVTGLIPQQICVCPCYTALESHTEPPFVIQGSAASWLQAHCVSDKCNLYLMVVLFYADVLSRWL